MSVEKNGGESATETKVSRQADNLDVPKMEEEVIESKTDQSKVSAYDREVDATNSAGTNDLEAKETEIRQWFKGLSSEELWETLGIEDGKYLETLLTIPSWSRAVPSGEGDERGTMEWDSLVSLKTLESAYSKLVDGKDESEAEASSGAVAEAVAIEEVTSGSRDADTDVSSNAPRIRMHSGGDSGGDVVASQVVVDNFRGVSEASRFFLDEVCTVFPSARRIPGDSGDDALPLVSIRPTYLDKTNAEEVLLALDGLAQVSVGDSFLSVDFLDGEPSPLWLARLLRHHGVEALVPLYMILVSRFASAAVDSFMSRSQRHELLTSANTPNVDKPGDEEKGGEEKKAGSEDVVATLATLRSRCRHFESVGQCLNVSEVKRLVGPLQTVFFTRNAQDPSLAVENFFFVGLLQILRAKMETSTLDVPSLDHAVRSTLHMIEEPRSCQEVESPVTVGISQTEEAVASGVTLAEDQSIMVAEEKHPTGQKKRKRKNKKRKKGKSTAAGATPNVVKESTPNVAEGSSDTLASEETPEPSEPTTAEETEEAEMDYKVAIGSSRSVESEETETVTVASTSPEAVPDKTASSTDVAPTTEVHVSNSGGVLVVSTPDAGTVSRGTSDADASEVDRSNSEQDEDEWNTVEVRGRGGRKKSERASQTLNRAAQYSSSSNGMNGSADSYHSASKKAKGARTAASRRRVVTRKMVREILGGILDAVEDESKRKKQITPVPRPVTNAWKTGPPGSKSFASIPRPAIAEISPAPAVERKDTTLRDVLLGTHVSPSKASAADTIASGEKRGARSKLRDSPRKGQEVLSKTGGVRGKGHAGTAADQNTAPTYTETVSAVSSNSNVRAESKEHALSASTNNEISKSGSISDETDADEAPQNEVSPAPTNQDVALTPPLPTLLSAENANSATSSVASSLEVPMAGHRHHHHSNSAVDVNDVGYHLLDVCDRLGRDMDLFMSRRALALNARRRERGALLGALQDSVSRIWPGRCHVEMYGSCATQLDLPSSDLDVVVLGLDHNISVAPSPQSLSRAKSLGGESIGRSNSAGEGDLTEEPGAKHPPPPPPLQQHVTVAPFVPMGQRNSERVSRLAAELEVQPWAVQVNAITTAAVPVIKVLADPSKINGSGDWAAHQQNLAAQAAAVTGAHADADTGRRQSFPSQPTLLPWRGADVMNGLLSLDITFEGPEHGGIGSTEFSMRTVAEVCHETGLQPDATPFVQVVMVLKEILAQRKLNEPYSGGLSSYALLLLVVALMRERAVIREEIERAEWQRQAMTASDPNPGISSALTNKVANSKNLKASSSVRDVSRTGTESAASEYEKLLPKKDTVNRPLSSQAKKNSAKSAEEVRAREPSPKLRTVSSWASIAKKNAPSPSSSIPPDPAKAPMDPKPSRQGQKKSTKGGQKPPTFADALTRPSMPTAPTEGPASVDTGNSTKEKSSKPGSSAAVLTAKPDAAEVKAAPTGTSANTTGSAAPSSAESSLVATPSNFPHAFNDVIEVLCSGEPTAGKLLMHFLLFYGEHFNAQNAAIDISGKHERDYSPQAQFSYRSPFIQRRAPPHIDPFTGMLTVDQIVIYDPLEGAENNNVARRCFAWPSVRWLFAQSYATLSSAVERSATPPTTPSCRVTAAPPVNDVQEGEGGTSASYKAEAAGDLNDPSSPLLRCLLSF